MNRFLVFILVVGFFYICSAFSGGKLTASSECVNHDCVVSAAASPASIVGALILLVFVSFYRQAPFEKSPIAVGVWRRFGAFFLDYALTLFILSPVYTLPILIGEASHVGNFSWSFEREFSRPSDTAFLLPGIFATFVGILFYFYIHLRMSRQTVGQYVFGYRIVDGSLKNGSPAYVKRVLLAPIGLCAWPVSVIFALRNPTKAFWWDIVSNTFAVKKYMPNKAMLNNP